MAITKNTAKFVKEGNTLDYKTGSSETLSCGTIKKIGSLFCLALYSVPSSTACSLKILQRGEVITITTDDKIGAVNANVAIYLDSDGLVTTTATNNTLIGYTTKAVLATDLSFDIVCV